MLRLCNIVKDYISGDSTVHALRDVSINFRKSEFVSILGHSGCGKTTMLNIVGGLDQYTSGDLIINGKSTKQYKDRDWDNYRNHSIGFVFQSYNLIPHQSVLGNVELALTLSGVSRAERKALAKSALEKVGLGDQISKRPNQLSGGQMQRVAIARALVNNPDIILADEPTGALDSETSVQIMDLLKEVAADKLVIMVTHNPELAEQYSTRIIRLQDGQVVSDSKPYTDDEIVADEQAAAAEEATSAQEGTSKRKKREKKPSMGAITALSLSIRNLLTKKGRTFLTAFAGSIGIIGIALILSLSTGFQAYIDQIERGTLSAYPIQIMETSYSTDAIMNAMEIGKSTHKEYSDVKEVYSNDVLGNMIKGLTGAVSKNDLKSFKAWLEAHPEKTEGLTEAIQYVYPTNFSVYSSTYSNINNQQLYPYEMPAEVQSIFGGNTDNMMATYMKTIMDELAIWEEMIDNKEALSEQYEVIAGNWPKQHKASDGGVFDVVLVVDEYNQIGDFLLCAIGLKQINQVLIDGYKDDVKPTTWSFDELLWNEAEQTGLTYKVVLETDKYVKEGSTWQYKGDDKKYMQSVLDDAITLRISGIVRPREGVTSSLLSGAVCYTSDLTNYVIEKTAATQIVADQLADTEHSVFTGEAFNTDENESYLDVMTELGYATLDTPTAIYLYAGGFEEKEQLSALIKEYNASVGEEQQIKYTDMVAMLMGSVSDIVNAVSYVLIAFVSISLVVSSIMIGIITYISVLERTKEIGVLRSIGASKHDISRLFNAETLSIGFMAGAFGILITLLLNIPINAIIKSLTGLGGLAQLPVVGAVVLIAISMLLTLIAGFVPAKIAAKKDPVVALRTE